MSKRNDPQPVRLVGQHLEFYNAAGNMVYDPLVIGILDEIEHLEEKNWFTPAHVAQLLKLAARGIKLSCKPVVS